MLNHITVNRSQTAIKNGAYVLHRAINHAKYSSCEECLLRAWPTDGKASLSKKEFDEKIYPRIKESDISYILKDPSQPLTEDEIYSIYHYTYDSSDLTKTLMKGQASVYDCYLDYFYSGFNKLGKSPEGIVYIGIRGDDYAKSLNLFNSNNEYIGEGKTLTTNSITSSSDLLEIAMKFASNQLNLVINVTKSTVPRYISPLSHFDYESEYIIPPMYQLKLGKSYIRYCENLYGYNDTVCFDEEQFFHTYKTYFVEAEEVSLGEPSWYVYTPTPTPIFTPQSQGFLSQMYDKVVQDVKYGIVMIVLSVCSFITWVINTVIMCIFRVANRNNRNEASTPVL